MRARLAAISSSEALAAGRAIDERLCLLPAWQRARWIALFVSQPDEIATNALIERASRAQKLVLPRIVGRRELEFRAVADHTDLSPGAFGIPEPQTRCPEVQLDERDLVVVPGLAFDRSGGRLGRGAGYYDRALARLIASGRRPIVAGVGFSFQQIERVPMTAHDVRVDLVVTDIETLEVAGSGAVSRP